MCCNRRKQQRRLDLQNQLLFLPQVSPCLRSCCGARHQQKLLEAAAIDTQKYLQVSEVAQQRCFETIPHSQRPTMAAIIAVGIGIGAEKLGRKISEKRLERKEKKSAAVRLSSRLPSSQLVGYLAWFNMPLTKIRNARPYMAVPNLRQQAQFNAGAKVRVRGSTGRVKRQDSSKGLRIDGGV